MKNQVHEIAMAGAEVVVEQQLPFLRGERREQWIRIFYDVISVALMVYEERGRTTKATYSMN